MTMIVHGNSALDRAEQATQVLFGGSLEGLAVNDIEEIFAEVPSSEITPDELSGEGKNILDILATTGLVKSKGEARRSIVEGGMNLNNIRLTDENYFVTKNDLVSDNFLVFRKGKKNYHLVKVRK